ncbi:hypothetical protein [Deinococcus sp. QL22]|uniref:hypothetical protein n=1 Tax=Deinococcus sp. QL22 TaxID=2939437 RepID=UPI00201832A7|nr:hypothetical protein [Deinococcus sp. QL22]UQN09402.1 hypothetical protein M1R55_22865 [Deinococcus sp. QL22]
MPRRFQPGRRFGLSQLFRAFLRQQSFTVGRMYRIRHTTFPIGRAVEVPRYQIEAAPGNKLELIQEVRRLRVDFATFDARAVACATDIQPEGWEIRGLIAVDAVHFAHALQQATATGTSRKFGAVLGDEWYLLAPIEWHVPPQAGQFVVVGLYR